MEIFKDIEDFKGLYQISNRGVVKSLPKKLYNGKVYFISKEKNLIPLICKKNNHLQVGLYKNKKRYPKYIHRLVLETFKDKYPEKMECRHLDGDPENNFLENLKWGTTKENQIDRFKHGTANIGEKHPMHKLKEQEIIFIQFLANKKIKQSLIMKMFKISRTQLYRIKKKITWSHLW